MVFASLTFLFVFLPLNLLLYYSSGNKNYRNWILIIFSFFFYAWGEPVWISLLIISATVDYINALVIARNRDNAWAKFGLVSSLMVNLGLLLTFKYSSFIIGNVNFILGTHFTEPSFGLPVGISFYTFQTISYVVDVYRNQVKEQTSYPKFLLFVSLYHQLVAGPIVRYIHIAHEIDHRKFDLTDISSGVGRFCSGLFKKVFFANVAGEMAAQYLDGDLSLVSVGGAWFGLLMFTFQIYFDFSGYSDMAIGLGRMFGFHYHENFDHPYIARSATEFWRRWHISLGSFFRDYLYIPLGGNKTHAYRNLIIVWFLTGLWHGASWNFIVWGLYFGWLITIERLFLMDILERLPKLVGHVYLTIVVILGWAVFYFTDLSRLVKFFVAATGLAGNPLWNFELGIQLQGLSIWLALAILACTPIVGWIKDYLANRNLAYKVSLYFSIIANFLMLVIGTSLLVGKSYNPFLYFRF